MSFERVSTYTIVPLLFAAVNAYAQTGTPTSQQNVAPQAQPPVQEPKILEDGGFSIEPMYWLNRAQPAMNGGAAATTYEGQDFPGHANPGIGGEFSIPTGNSNTLRISYFRVLGNADTTETQSVTVFSQAYSPGDYVTSHYNLQSAKISWDYLSYTWRKGPGNIHFKTLYEMQLANIATNFAAPFKPVTTDSSGNTNDNMASGTKRIFLPTFGGELEQALGHRFRWEIKGSGFGIPHHGVIWDAQADIALRVQNFELIAGEKAYHFKTSPQAEQYFTDTLNGVFAGIRYYLPSTKK
jgi:hypothetical protein